VAAAQQEDRPPSDHRKYRASTGRVKEKSTFFGFLYEHDPGQLVWPVKQFAG